MEKINKLVFQYIAGLMNKENVVGVGVGYKIKDGKDTGIPAIMVFVEKKMPKEDLVRSQFIPEKLEGAHTDVIETGEIRLLNERTSKARPAQPGMSIGHYKISAGTFGAVVKDAVTKEPYILSNNHILANVTNGKDNRAKIGDPILQPGTYDGGTNQDIIAHLHRFVPVNIEGQPPSCPVAQFFEMLLNRILVFIRPNYKFRLEKYSFENLVDAALAKPISQDMISSEILGLGSIKGVKKGMPGLNVQKSGRSSGITKGKIRSIDAYVKVNMGDKKEAVFNKQLVSDPIAKPGDSGSIVIDTDNNAVGLLFAGSDKITIINPIQHVFKELNVEL